MDSEDDELKEIYGIKGALPTVATALALTPKVKKEHQRLNARSGVKASPQVVGVSPAGFSPAIDTQSEKYGSRKNAGDVVFRYKCKDSTPWEAQRSDEEKWKIESIDPTSKLHPNEYKFMFQKIKEMARALDYLVDKIGKGIFKQLTEAGEDVENRGSLKDMSVEESLYLGRIRSDGRLTSGSVYFEGCLDYSDGHVVSLDLSAVDEYYVFPGQVAVLEGKNEMGKCLRVSKIHLPSPLPLEKIKIESKLGYLNIIMAVGPFTPSDSLKYEPLTDLISVITKEQPDVCILMGPFIEARHKLIDGGELPMTFDELLQGQVQHLEEALQPLRTKVVLVPSFKDVHGQFVYPTPPYSLKRSNKLIVLPDPGTISVGGIIIGTTSTDILMHLSKNELANSSFNGDRMGRLARHLLSQHNFYSLYPCDETVPLDVEHWVKYSRLSISPHILIVPSDLRHFIKDIDGTIVVNPERLTKGSSGGTFARLQIDLSSAPQDGSISSIADFCVGEIVKI